MDEKLAIVSMLTIGFCLASLLGYICQKVKLPSVLGFLLAGYAIGPFSPGFVADIHTAEQLAEIGVILMLFGVGMHFHIEDLLNVRSIAIPGAVVQTVTATIACTLFMHYWMGWSLASGIILGFSIGVASTVVLVRVLSDNNLLQSHEGHVAVGWLIVEDIFTVVILILLPLLATLYTHQQLATVEIAKTVLVMLFKFSLLGLALFLWGHKIVTFILTSVARMRSQELFTLTVLGLIFAIATGAASLFGTSIALGAFLAGMIIGQTEAKHQASANALPLRDVFTVIFFLTVGMLFNPRAIYDHFSLCAGILFIILVIKPLIAFLIVALFRQPLHVALTVAIALAQIGEFSFILAEEAMRIKLLPDDGFDIIVACALISISLNPLLFRLTLSQKNSSEKSPPFCAKKLLHPPKKYAKVFESRIIEHPNVIVIGYGPTGEAISQDLQARQLSPTIVENNIDTVTLLRKQGVGVVFGDASQPAILAAANIATAQLLIITVPETAIALAIIEAARHLSPHIPILSKVLSLREEPLFHTHLVETICCERECMKEFRAAMWRATIWRTLR